MSGFLHWRCLRCGRWTLDRWTAHSCENGHAITPPFASENGSAVTPPEAAQNGSNRADGES